jgi:Iap family predicted aminopeptidase
MPASKLSKDHLPQILKALEADKGLLADFHALCDFGGRRAGTESERRALTWLRGKLSTMGGRFRSEPVTYAGWTPGPCSLSLVDGETAGTSLAVNPLLGAQSTPPEGLVAEVVDLGRGTEEDFARHASALKGRIALVRHEYMFSSQTIHRRKKLGWAMERGAAGFLIANPDPGAGPVSGSSGRAGGAGIPAAATDFESSVQLKNKKARLIISGTDHDSTTEVLILDLPGRSDRWVILSAHVDGHDLAESALDNATGVAVALAVTRVLAPHVKDRERGLRLCLFSAEEWALAGSKQYLDRMDPSERAKMEMNINLDTVAGDNHLTALTSDFPALDAWVKKVAKENGMELGTYLPTMQSSDHFHFARHGIPAMRLVAGFDRRESSVQYVLTPLDRRNKAKAAQLSRAGRAAAILAWNAFNSIGEQLTR